MSWREFFLPYKPRREDPLGHMIVQQNLDELLKVLNAMRSSMYVGMCVPWPGDNASFTGTGLVWADDAELWAWCNGHTAMSKSIYADLYEFLGTVYSIDGSSFRLPDYSNGRSPIGKGAAFPTVAANGGAASHTLAIAEMPAHDHATVHPGPDEHVHFYNKVFAGGANIAAGGVYGILENQLTGPPSHVNEMQGGGGSHNIMDPYQVAGGWVILTRDPLGE